MGQLLYNDNAKKMNERAFIDSHLYRTNSMYTFIKMEYLVASALVELYENKQINKISLNIIREYGVKVEEDLNSKDDTKAILLYSNNYTKEFLCDYSNYFELADDEYIQIKDGVNAEDIRENILSYVSLDLLLALLNSDALKIINIG